MPGMATQTVAESGQAYAPRQSQTVGYLFWSEAAAHICSFWASVMHSHGLSSHCFYDIETADSSSRTEEQWRHCSLKCTA